jgi:hypothetical protein
MPKHHNAYNAQKILQRWFDGETIAHIAATRGVTAQAVHKSINRNKACRLRHAWEPMPFMRPLRICSRCGATSGRYTADNCALVLPEQRREELASIFNVALRRAEKRFGYELPYTFSANQRGVEK